MRRTLALVLAGGLILGLLTGSEADVAPRAVRTNESRLHVLTNYARTTRGIHRLDVKHRLRRFAERHSRRMARRGELFHSPNLEKLGPYIGENIGVTSGSVWQLHQALMASVPHRLNILDTNFDVVGFGAFRDNHGLLWVTEVFKGRVPAIRAPAGLEA